MIELKNIKQDKKYISMIVLPDGKEDQAFSLVLDAETLEEVSNSSGEPSSYSGHARVKIRMLLQESDVLPEEAVMWWY